MSRDAIALARNASCLAERIDAALALAGLTWGQFAKMTGAKRAWMHGLRRRRLVALVADYARVSAEWIRTGETPALDVPIPRPARMPDQDYAALCMLLALIGDAGGTTASREVARG